MSSSKVRSTLALRAAEVLQKAVGTGARRRGRWGSAGRVEG